MTEEAYASNPANVKPELLKFFQTQIKPILFVIFVLSIIFIPLGLLVWKWLLPGLLLIPAAIFLIHYGQCRLMKLGNCLPAKVLSLDPPRLAIFSDMTMREDACHPAIVVKEFSPGSLTGPKVKVGDRLAVAAFYIPGDEDLPEERWKTLSVMEPIRAVTTNPQDILRTYESLEDDDWKQLDAGIKLSQPPFEEQIIFLEQGRREGGMGVPEGRVHLVPSDDETLKKAQAYGRKTFRFFLRELSWEKRRIVPGLEISAVKVAFSDPPEIRSQNPGGLETEYMWISDVEFDGRKVSGTLLNEPDSLQSVHEGDHVSVNPSQIVDWLYSVMGEVCGGFTIQAMRCNMSPREMKKHDAAWGLNFGDAGAVRLVPDNYIPEVARKKRTPLPEMENMFILGDYKVIENQEHPMSVNMRNSLEESIRKNPEFLQSPDDWGLSMLHHMAIAGSLDGVDVCLKCGADPHQKAANGLTPVALAKGLGWKKVLARLEQAGT